MGDIYHEPGAYALACAFRDVPAEVDAVLGWCARHRDAPVRTVLELAAGPAEHALELARRGVACTALDLEPAMCEYARRYADDEGTALDVVQADMTDFTLDRRFDLVVTMLDSTAHLMTLDAFVAYLRRVAAHLDDDGLAVIEMSHPVDRLGDAPRTSSHWRVEWDGGAATVRWGEPDDVLDPVTQVVREHVTITVRRANGTDLVASGVVPYRFWTATELDAAIRLAGGLVVAARYGDFADDVPVDSPSAWRMITILRRP